MKKDYYESGDRVVVKKTQERGEIAKDTTLLHATRQYEVKLDEGNTISGNANELERECLNEHDRNTKIKKLQDEIKERASQLPYKMGQQLPENLNNLKEALEFKNQSRFDSEYKYIFSQLEIAFKTKPVTDEEWTKITKITLKQLQHCLKTLLESSCD
ncbi:MAG: hypothetical protein V7K18_01090 [Nostoc sp.]|uniref:hypothetical protein n=1 Tax=Nostoc sp. TaxID=1180 RepID=UPI002FF4C06F